MYVIPADAVPAIATRPSINLQTGVVVQHSSGYVQMPQEGLIYSASRNVLASGDEAIRKDMATTGGDFSAIKIFRWLMLKSFRYLVYDGLIIPKRFQCKSTDTIVQLINCYIYCDIVTCPDCIFCMTIT